MFCPNCGKQLENEQFCPSCGASNPNLQTTNNVVNSQITDTNVPSDLFCPSCGSHELQLIVENDTITTGKNFSAGKGCLGYLLMGPLGILCGSCGQQQKTIVKNKQFFVCSKCGKKFRNPEELRTQLEQNKKNVKTIGIVGIILTVIMFIYAIFMSKSFGMSFMILFPIMFAVCMGILFVVMCNTKNKTEEELNVLEKEMAKFKNGNL